MSQLSRQKKTEWAEHIRNQPLTGLTQQAYCEKLSLKPHRFWYWKKKLSSNESPPVQNTETAKPSTAFVPVTVNKMPSVSGLRMTLPNGVIISDITEHNIQLVERLVGDML